MTESFGKSFPLSIFYFLIIFSNTYAWSCTSEEGVPPEVFSRKQFPYAAYVKNVVIELARNFHWTFGLDEPLEICNRLLQVQTIIAGEEVYHIDPADDVQQIVNTIHNLASLIFETFSKVAIDTNFRIDEQKRREIFDFTNVAIYRLLKARRFFNHSLFIENIRTLRKSYCKSYQRKGLIINGVSVLEIPSTPEILFDTYDGVARSTTKFKSRNKNEIEEPNVLYVSHAEKAVTVTSDENVRILGSDGASTSIIVIIEALGTDVIGIVHVDENANTQQELSILLSEISMTQENNRNFRMSLIGGMSDPNGTGEDNYFNILDAIHKQDIGTVHLNFACIGDYNTSSGWSQNNSVHTIGPTISGVAIDFELSGKDRIYPATFKNPGPEIGLRIIRYLSFRNYIFNTYNFDEGQFIIEAFDYEADFDVNEMLGRRNDYIISHFGNAFGYDPDATKIRNALNYFHYYPSPQIAFPNGIPRIYVRDKNNGLWILRED